MKKRNRFIRPVFKTHNFIITTNHSLYSKKPSEVAKTTSRENISDSLWNMWSFTQQQIFLTVRKRLEVSNKLSNEIQAVFRCNKKLAEYA